MELVDVQYFADENALGLAKLLIRAGREDIVHPGRELLPKVPLGTLDTDWMPEVAYHDLIVLSRDRRFRTRPAELAAYRNLGIRSVWIGGKKDLTPMDQMNLFLKHESRLQREAIKRGPGPWALSMSPSSLRPLRMGE